MKLILLLIALWAIPWKIYAVWLAAKRDEKIWFVALLLLNTAAVLEIIYIFAIAKRKWSDIKTDFKETMASFRTGKEKTATAA